MKTIYFIDNESIKRTAKAIQKTNTTFKHTIILDDLAKLLGYTSYNQYEHYLTNAILSKDNSLKSLKPLTKLNSVELLILQDKFIDDLKIVGYSVDELYFIKKIIDNQTQGFIEHSHLNLISYMFYLLFIFKPENSKESFIDFSFRNSNLENVIKLVMSEYETIDIEPIKILIQKLNSSPDYSLDDELFNEFESLRNHLKTRGIYYYIKSIVEDFDYDEGYLTKLIFEGYSVEKIEHYINIRIKQQQLISNEEIPVFFKNDKQITLQNYYPFIRESVTEEQPFIFGRQVDHSPFFATPEHLHSNISVLGAPGTGKGVFIHSFMFQLMMNNRGFCVMNTLGRDYSTTYIKNMAALLNKKNDMFVFNTDASTTLISSSIHNDKIVYTTFDTRDDARRNVDTLRLGSNRFEQILIALTEQFYTSKFRNKKIPFYIIIEEAHNLMNINENTANMIKKLNELNIFFVFDHQLHEDYINDLCDTTLVTNSSFFLFKNATNFEFKQLMINLYDRKELIGTTGPSKNLPPVFSIIQKGVHVGQFITEIDEDLYNNIQKK